MHSDVFSNWKVGAIFLFIIISAIVSTKPLRADTIKIECKDNSRYEVDTSQNTLRVGQTEEAIEWSFDGEWVRLRRNAGRSPLAFGLTTGIRILDGQSSEHFCYFENRRRVEELPVSSTAELREVFIAKSPADRRSLQKNLKDFDYYEGEIDGLWGAGTAEAVMDFAEDNKNIFGDENDITSRRGATEILSVLADYVSEAGECDGCEDAPLVASDRNTATEHDRRRDQEPEISEQEVASLRKICDGAIQIKEVCWAQNHNQMKAVLRSKGYECGTKAGLFGPVQRCTIGDAKITLYDESLVFSCENFNTCQYSLGEIKEIIEDQGLVEKLIYNVELISDGTNYFQEESYCGRGEKGDKICVTDKTLFPDFPVIDITLRRDAFGKGEVSFD